MLKEPAPQQYQFEMVTLDELVPEDHSVRKVDAAIDFEFIRDAVKHLYCAYQEDGTADASLSHFQGDILRDKRR